MIGRAFVPSNVPVCPRYAVANVVYAYRSPIFSESREVSLISSCPEKCHAVYAPPKVSEGKPRPALEGRPRTQSAKESPVRVGLAGFCVFWPLNVQLPM